MATDMDKRCDTDNHRFWKTQPVPQYQEIVAHEDGPITALSVEEAPERPSPLIPGFEWVLIDLKSDAEIDDLFQLLLNNYAESDGAMFRFKYSASFLEWALKPPGWRKDFHIGVRATDSQRLVAFISAIPVRLRIKENVVDSAEINFMCVHKKIRSKRLAPLLIQEIARRCQRAGIFQALYTGGTLLPSPVSTCKYYHRSLNWQKLYEVGFVSLPSGSNMERQRRLFDLPKNPNTYGLRPMEPRDAVEVADLLKRYLDRTQLALNFSCDEVEHWLLGSNKSEKVVFSYVVERGGKITDFFSFYRLDLTVIGKKAYSSVQTANLYYYATDVVLQADYYNDRKALSKRLNQIMNDALILARKNGFDVFNALTLLDNPLFLQDQKFREGDGSLHYYLYNYRTAPISGGTKENGTLDQEQAGGVGVVML